MSRPVHGTLLVAALLAAAGPPSAPARACSSNDPGWCNMTGTQQLNGLDEPDHCGSSNSAWPGADLSFVFDDIPADQRVFVVGEPTTSGDIDLFIESDACNTGCWTSSTTDGSTAREVVEFVGDGQPTIFATFDLRSLVSGSVDYRVGCPTTCEPTTDVTDVLTCSSDLTGVDSNGSKVLDAYVCGSPLDYGVQVGPERIYSFTPQHTGSVTALLTTSDDLDLYVLEDLCDPGDHAACLDGDTTSGSGPSSVTFDAAIGHTYYLIVESTGGVGTFDLSFADDTGGCTEDCDNSVNDDGDGLADCADPDCASFPACQSCEDNDGDGYYASALCGEADCDDNDSSRSPGLLELPCNGIDDNCSGVPDENRQDGDGDGADECSDCNDGDDSINPQAAEICDGVDQDCNGYDMGGSLWDDGHNDQGSVADTFHGNHFVVDTGATLRVVTPYVGKDIAGLIDVAVYTSDDGAEPWTLLDSDRVGLATGLYAQPSKSFDLPLVPGRHYLIGYLTSTANDGFWRTDPSIDPAWGCWIEGVEASLGSIPAQLTGTSTKLSSQRIWVEATGGDDLDSDSFRACEECDDSDGTLNPNTWWWWDCDGDGAFVGGSQRQCDVPDAGCPDGEGPDGGFLTTAPSGDLDCNDDDPALVPGTIWSPDCDGDAYRAAAGQESCDPSVLDAGCVDGETPDGGWKTDAADVDCFDEDDIANTTVATYVDCDGDGVLGAAPTAACPGHEIWPCPEGATPNATSTIAPATPDCADDEPAMFPGANEDCLNEADDDCDLAIDCQDGECATDLACESIDTSTDSGDSGLAPLGDWSPKGYCACDASRRGATWLLLLPALLLARRRS